jgi:hypothetical protein
MSDLQRYIENRLARDPEFAEYFEEGYTDFKVGVLLRQAREAAGVRQEVPILGKRFDTGGKTLLFME